MQNTFMIANKMIIFPHNAVLPQALLNILHANAELHNDTRGRIIAATNSTATLGHVIIMLHLYNFTVASHEATRAEFISPEALKA